MPVPTGAGIRGEGGWAPPYTENPPPPPPPPTALRHDRLTAKTVSVSAGTGTRYSPHDSMTHLFLEQPS
ncbi:hypothetical protein [Bordetella pertussis]|uniref:hypothetical protein n=1 Tax=Bordetella pertussis TaxID=520 RepID=UPI00366E7267